MGLYLGWLRVKAAQETVRVAEEGQITERFTRAIEQLGQEGEGNMAIRLGGIYALERIAKDSEKDHGPIMEVLTAYVREKAHTPGGGPEDGREEDREEDPEEYIRLPTTDIQAILTVIGRRETTGNNRRNDPLNLTSTQLAGADLGGANLVGVRLDFADLRGADLRGPICAGPICSGPIWKGPTCAGPRTSQKNRFRRPKIFVTRSCRTTSPIWRSRYSPSARNEGSYQSRRPARLTRAIYV